MDGSFLDNHSLLGFKSCSFLYFLFPSLGIINIKKWILIVFPLRNYFLELFYYIFLGKSHYLLITRFLCTWDFPCCLYQLITLTVFSFIIVFTFPSFWAFQGYLSVYPYKYRNAQGNVIHTIISLGPLISLLQSECRLHYFSSILWFNDILTLGSRTLKMSSH